jgi:hypothetical protein
MVQRCGDSPSTDNSSTDFLSTPITRRQVRSRHFIDLNLLTGLTQTLSQASLARWPLTG